MSIKGTTPNEFNGIWQESKIYKKPKPGNQTDTKIESASKLIGRKVSPLDYLKSVGREFKIFGLYLKILVNKIRGNQGQVKKIKHKIEHIRTEENVLLQQIKLGKSYITPARNIIKMDYFGNKEAYEESVSKLIGDMKQVHGLECFEKQVNTLPETVKNGVCFGGCIEFTNKLFLQLEDKELTVAKFDHHILQTAENFRSGVGLAGVTYQMAFELLEAEQRHFIDLFASVMDRMEKGNEIDALQRKLVEILMFTFVFNKNRAFSSSYAKGYLKVQEDKILPNIDFAALSKEFDQDSNKLEALEKIMKGINEKKDPTTIKDEIKQVFSDPDRKFSDVVDVVYAFIEKYQENHPKFLSEEFKPENQKAELKDRISKKTSLKLSKKIDIVWQKIINTFMKKKPDILKHRNVRRLIELQMGLEFNQDVERKIAEAGGIKSDAMIEHFGMPGSKNDTEVLSGLNDVEDGIYHVGISTKGRGHATLFVKKGDNGYFWDPNFGLFTLEKGNFEKTVSKVLSSYGTPKGVPKNNHQIQITRYTRLTPEA